MNMIQLPRSNWMLVLLMVLAAALGAATLRAAAQSVMTGPRVQPPPAAAAPAQAPRGGQAPPDPHPTPAPDSRGSARYNVSFPVGLRAPSGAEAFRERAG